LQLKPAFPFLLSSAFQPLIDFIKSINEIDLLREKESEIFISAENKRYPPLNKHTTLHINRKKHSIIEEISPHFINIYIRVYNSSSL
jgi:hypothetical protein